MIDRKIVAELSLTLREMAVSIIKESTEEGYNMDHLKDENKASNAVWDAIVFHGNMQFFSVKKGIEDEELAKTLEHILSNKGEFREYFRNKLILA